MLSLQESISDQVLETLVHQEENYFELEFTL